MDFIIRADDINTVFEFILFTNNGMVVINRYLIGSPFLASYCYTIREQFGYRYAETACKERSELYGDFGLY
jgi:hypothetical protein